MTSELWIVELAWAIIMDQSLYKKKIDINRNTKGGIPGKLTSAFLLLRLYCNEAIL